MNSLILFDDPMKENLNSFQKDIIQKRSRRFSIISYIPIKHLELFICRSSWIQHYAYCVHDKDIGKDVHTHIIIYCYNAKTSSAVKKSFDRFSVEVSNLFGGDPQNTLVQNCKDVVSQFRYLRHLDDKDKYQYELCEVNVDSELYWKELCRYQGMTDSAQNVGLSIFDDMKSGVSTREMIARYGKEYIYHAHYYKNCIVDETREYFSCDAQEYTAQQFKEMCQDILLNSPLPMSKINSFYDVFDYLQTQIERQYGSRIVYTQTPK